MAVLVFATSVHSMQEAGLLAPRLNSLAGPGRWNFALDDEDRILRILRDDIYPQAAIQLLQEYGHDCKELPN